ncbi:hypothetical protein TNIN_493701 [Trichonephila inaurata madagascariensis]|uniref:Uncharacterized protein n=1 Tax=Trichonephila inaurata madagascariensis TaxID=2747483 RepID=A0A8X7BV37_9ARAC|nr:hypothetical protein TNIN_493701 [Trichonephila inaurata madagascariensis]
MPCLAYHGRRIDLAHVVTTVLQLDVFNLQPPGAVVIVVYGYAGISSDHLVVQSQQVVAVFVDPGQLLANKGKFVFQIELSLVVECAN